MKTAMMMRVGALGLGVVLLCLQAVSSVPVCGNNETATTNNVQADIQFLLDCSGSIADADFKKELDFVKQFVNSFSIGKDGVRIGVATYDTTLTPSVSMYLSFTKEDLITAIGKIRNCNGGTRTDLVLSFARTSMFGYSKEREKILIVITDGQSEYPAKTKEQARQIHKENIKVFAIGVGKNIRNSELQAISSTSNNWFHVSDFKALNGIQTKLKKTVCDSTCRDVLPNCDQYNSDSCRGTDFDWAIKNCRKTCNLCRKCYGDIVNLQPSGRKVGGVKKSNLEASLDAKSLTQYKNCFEAAADKYCVQSSVIAAIASRESGVGRLLKNGYGDNGKAWGVMQCDLKKSGLPCKDCEWDSCCHIDMMVGRKLVPDIKRVRAKLPRWTLEQQLQGAVAAYNFGVRSVRTWKGLDLNTTHDDYSNDVMARAKYLQRNGWN